MKKILLLAVLVIFALTDISAQKRNINLTINVTANTGENLQNQKISLKQTDYDVSYGDVILDANGSATVKVYAGPHALSISRDGYNDFSTTFSVSRDTTINCSLTESFQTPYALSTTVAHNAKTGLNDVTLTWNREKPVFFDDFESYDAFAINFGNWTGIDRDHLTSAPLTGSYPNRAVFEYAQIINPMKVEPTWWYDYPILRPYDGLQYVGFIRTGSNEPNDDWLISPEITPGKKNVLQFYARAADKYDEKFQVFVTEKTDNPTVDDFNMISSDNYESVDYKGWQLKSYDLSAYEGKKIKFAIRYLGNYNGAGAFMLMIDNVYVGQKPISNAYAIAPMHKAQRLNKPMNSPLNPNESFDVYLNDNKVGNTDQYSYSFSNLSKGTYKFGVQSVYKASRSEIIDTTVTIGGDYSAVTFNVSTNNSKAIDGSVLTMTSKKNGEVYTDTISEGKASFAYLPVGGYIADITATDFHPYTANITINRDTTINVMMEEIIVDPYNITADISYNSTNNNYDATVKWNQNLSFTDSFESYDDFATGSFGGWTTYDLDQHVCYPISLNGNMITFPGASTQQEPKAVPPMVFNPNSTTPPMTSDKAILAPDGDKTVIFFSPQQNGANKWLVSPKLLIRDNYVVRFAAKSYTDMYGNDQMEVAVSTDGNDPQTATFNTVSTINPLTAGQWVVYETDLSKYAGQEVYIGVHYTSYDCFLSQVDEFFVGNPDGNSFVDVGAVDHYNIYVDEVLVGETKTPTYNISGLSTGTHTIGIEAVYNSGKSKIVTYTINTTTGLNSISAEKSSYAKYNLNGQRVNNQYRGIIISNGHKFIRR